VCEVLTPPPLLGRQKRGFVDFLEEEFHKRYPAVRVFLDEYSLVPSEDALQSLHAKLGDADVGARMRVWGGCSWFSSGASSSLAACMPWRSPGSSALPRP
jgi:hypothetical protein